MTSVEVKIRMKPPQSVPKGSNRNRNRILKDSVADPPPSYDEALMLPDRVVLEDVPSDATAVLAQIEHVPSVLGRMGSDKRRISIPERADKDDDDTRVEEYEDDNEGYSVDDEAFEAYEEDLNSVSGAIYSENQDNSALPHAQGIELNESDDSSTHESSDGEDDGCFTSEQAKSSTVVYDEHTYFLISQLRTANKNLTSEVRRLKKQLESAQSRNKSLERSVRTLTKDLTMLKQTIRAFQTGKRDDDATSPRQNGIMRRKSRATPTLPMFAGPYEDRAPSGFSKIINSPWAPVSRSSSLPSPSHGSPARRYIRTSCEEISIPQHHEEMMIKLRMLEKERHEAHARNAHQLANYSHELSRLERQLEQAHRQVQEKDNRLRLQKVRHLYASSSISQAIRREDPPTAVSGNQSQTRIKSMLSDDLWADLLPPHEYDHQGHRVNTTFSSHIGVAFEQLLSHQLTAFHDHALDGSTRDWLQEVRACGTQMLQLHNSFQSMGRTLQRLAECSNVYKLAEVFASECCKLLQAEQTLVFIVDTTEEEFWCRVPRVTDGKEMNTVRSKLMPFATPISRSSRHSSSDSLTGDDSSRPGLPCGLASMVYHTKRPLLLLAGHITKHPCYSSAMDNTDRLIAHTSVSSLLVPILHHGVVQGIVQLCGKTTHIEALGLSIALEKCDSFSREDQLILTLLSHFVSGILPKVTYFTEVESNKLNEETLLQLAPEIFTCLRFEDLGKIIIQNAKDILDADRCSLFVADNTDRTLHNWQSDINGTGVEVYSDAKKVGMTIPFGYGIVGLVAETWQPINIVDAYEDPRFNSSWDQKTKYRTKSMLTVPILTTAVRKHRRRRSIRGEQDRSTSAGENQYQPSDPVESTEPMIKQSLLGVVQVINKSGGAPFRAKDEFLLQTISKLIALAIENSQLFQKNQELCRNVGKLISGGDMIEAMISLSASVEELLGVERAAVYVYDTHTQDMVTFHPKRRHKIMVKEAVYRQALFGEAVAHKKLLIVNDLTAVSNFNAYVDSIAGCVARNLLFAPLLVEDDSDSASGTKLLGMIHLVNTKGRKINFDRHDLFLSIVTNLCTSVLSSIIEKQMMLRQKEQSTQLLDTSMSFFKEMSPIGIINAVYNACTSIFNVEKAHLFLWEGDRRHMWTSKLSPTAEASAAYAAAASSNASSSLVLTPMGSANGQTTSLSTATVNHIPSLGSQTRRISVLTDQTLRVPTTEGLLEQVLVKGVTIIIKQWITPNDGSNPADESSNPDQVEHRVPLVNSVRSSQSKYTSQASASDERNGFTKHSVVACPVWDNYGLDIVGVLVLFFQKGRAPVDGELANLPILTRQISGALNVCGDLSGISSRCKQLQSQVELSMRRPDHIMSLTLSARGHLASYSEPVNGGTGVFSESAMMSSLNSTTALNIGISSLLSMDDDGHRWVFQLSGVKLQQMKSDHYIQWIGKDLPATPSVIFDKMRTDIQSVYMRKESVTGVIDRRRTKPPEYKTEAMSESNLNRPLEIKIRRLLWEYVDDAWQIDLQRACAIFDSVNSLVDTTKRSDQTTHFQPVHLVSTQNLEGVLSGLSRNLLLTQVELDLLHEQFADRATNLIDVERMFSTLAPELKVIPFFRYEIVPVLDPIMHTVVNIHILLTALM